MTAVLTLRTGRLLLRRPRPEDVAAMHAILGDAEAMRYWSTLPHAQLAESEAWVAATIQAIERGDCDDFFVERDGRVFINDQVVPIDQVSNMVLPMRSDNPKLLIVLRADSEVPYQYIDAVTKELQEAAAVRVTFYTNVERRMLRQRR